MIFLSRRQVFPIVSLVAFVLSTSGCSRETGQTKSGESAAVSSTAPSMIVNTPVSGAGNQLSTSVMFHDNAGQMNITELFLLISDPARGADGTRGCVEWYKRSTGDVYLLDDAGKGWLGPRKAGSKGVLVNSQCLISMGNTGLGEVNGDLQWVTSVGFAQGFSGPKNIYAKALNRQNQEGNFALVGTWTVK